MEYLKRVLGIEVTCESRPIRHLPNFISTRYTLKGASLDGQKVVFLFPKTELEQIEALKKHLERVQESEKLPVVLVLDRITSRQKEYLLREKIPFVVKEKQIYLPFMAMYLQERCNAEKIQQEKMIPSAHVLLLYFIYHGAGKITTHQAAKDLNFTPTSISRASRQLEEMGLLKAKKAGVQKILFSDAVPKELFQTAEPKLLDPVKRTVYLPKDSVKAEWLESGYLALAEYSMLNTPKISCYATNKAVPNALLTSRLQDSRSQVAVELWRYDPRRLSGRKTVDELSLALALRNDPDERVEEAVEEMLDCLWRKIDGKRN